MVRISIRDLSKTFVQGPREVPAVSNVSFDIRDKEFVALVGPSGCGKSTILNMIGALVAPSGGEIVVDGERVGGAPPPKVGYVFQKDTVFPWRTVERNIALGLEYRGIPAAERAARVREAIALAGLEGFEEAFPATLSGGMRRRVAEWQFTPNGSEGFAKAEVTIGGISTAELSSQTMESKRVPGLFAIGEAVDVTGWLGGYNFQWAWASAHAAAQSL